MMTTSHQTYPPASRDFGGLVESHSHTRGNNEPNTFNKPGISPIPHNFEAMSSRGPPSLPHSFEAMNLRGPTCPARDETPTDYMQFHIFNDDILKAPGYPELDKFEFAVCDTCYSSHMLQYPNVVHKLKPLDKKPPRNDAIAQKWPQASYDSLICSFSFPRVKETFYNECVRMNSLQPLIDYTRRIAALGGCARLPLETSFDFYGPRNDLDFGMCETCFENYVRCTKFESQFVRQTYTAQPGIAWICDVGLSGFIFRVLMQELNQSQPNFTRFIDRITPKFNLPSCPGPKNAIAPAGSGPGYYAYGSVEGKTGHFCQECWFEHVAATNFEQRFSNLFELDENQQGKSPCDLASIYSQFAMKVAIKRNDDEVWRQAFGMSEKIPQCSGLKGIDEEEMIQQQNTNQDQDLLTWYSLIPFPNIEVCKFCYSGTVELYGASNLFAPVTRQLQPGTIRTCYLYYGHSEDPTTTEKPENFESTLSWRGYLLRLSLWHGHTSGGDFSTFLALARRISELPKPCLSNKRALKPISKRKWMGRRAKTPTDDITLVICPECYYNIAKGTILEHELAEDLTPEANTFQQGFCCNTYDHELRAKLLETCENGNWMIFVQYWRLREEQRKKQEEIDAVRNQQQDMMNQMSELTRMRMAQQTQTASLNLMMQLNANTNYLIRHI